MEKYKLIPVLCAMSLLAFYVCDKGEGNVIAGDGVIVYSSLEGGCWGITVDAGITYEVEYLPSACRQDGLRVHFEAKISESQASFCQMGDRIIEIVRIYRL